MNRKKKEIAFYITTVLSCLVAMTVVVIAALLIYDRLIRKEQEEAEQAVAEVEVITYSEDEVNLMLAEAIATAESQTREQVSGEILSRIQDSLTGGTSTVETLRQSVSSTRSVLTTFPAHRSVCLSRVCQPLRLPSSRANS